MQQEEPVSHHRGMAEGQNAPPEPQILHLVVNNPNGDLELQGVIWSHTYDIVVVAMLRPIDGVDLPSTCECNGWWSANGGDFTRTLGSAISTYQHITVNKTYRFTL
jgi:hypothetical protein